MFHGETMGTTWSVSLVDRENVDPDRQQTWRQNIQNRLDAVDAQMSHWRHDSDLGRFNRAPAGSWHPLPDAFFEVLSYALGIAAASDGAYDPTAGALVNIWGFGPTGRHDQPGFQLPGASAIEAAHELGGWRRLLVDTEKRSICQPGGMLLDLSAVAKGYAVDRVALYLKSAGIAHYLVEVGGELRGAGMKPDRQPWWVALESPTASTSPPTSIQAPVETIVALHGLSIATSGDYRRVYQANGRQLSHTIDPRDGHPIHNNVASVTLLHASCMEADALSTALTVLGVEDGLSFAEQHRFAARFLVRTNTGFTERTSSAFLAMLQ